MVVQKQTREADICKQRRTTGPDLESVRAAASSPDDFPVPSSTHVVMHFLLDQSLLNIPVVLGNLVRTQMAFSSGFTSHSWTFQDMRNPFNKFYFIFSGCLFLATKLSLKYLSIKMMKGTGKRAGRGCFSLKIPQLFASVHKGLSCLWYISTCVLLQDQVWEQ